MLLLCPLLISFFLKILILLVLNFVNQIRNGLISHWSTVAGIACAYGEISVSLSISSCVSSSRNYNFTDKLTYWHTDKQSDTLLCRTLHDFVGLCRTMFDYLWLCMTKYDYVWLCMTLYDFVWLCMTVYEYLYLCMTMYDILWICMTMFDNE